MKHFVLLELSLPFIRIMGVIQHESHSLETPLFLGVLGVEPTVSWGGLGGRRFGVLPFRRLADES